MSANVLKFSGAIRVGNLASDPSAPQNGLIYYNTTLGKFRKYEDGDWGDIAANEVLDSVFRIQNSTDPTKQIAFDASAIGGSNTRTIIMPNANVDLGLVATAIQSSEKGSANGVATLGADGKLPSAQLPALAISDTFVVASQAAQEALTAEVGDVAVRTDENKSYILRLAGPETFSNWQEILTPADGVTSVNGNAGPSVVLDTDDINEGSTNLYYTTTRARADVIASSISNGDTTHAPSGDAVFDALALKLANVVEDTTPQLGGALDLNGQNVEGLFKRAAVGGTSNFVEQEYFHALTLTASQTDTVLASLTIAHATYEGMDIDYKIKEATTNRVRIGRLRIATNGTDTSCVDDFHETGDVGVTWTVAINGANLEVKYTTTANNKTMRADVKRFKA